MAAFTRYKITRDPGQRVPADEKIGPWLTKEGHPFFASVRKIVNWLCELIGYAAVDSTDNPGALEDKIIGTDRITVTKTGTAGARTLTIDLDDDWRKWDVTWCVAGLLNSSEVYPSVPIVRYCKLPAGLVDSFGSVLVAPLANATLTIKNNSTTIGTITIASGATQCVFTFAADVTFTPGVDNLNIVNQAVADAQMAGLRVTLKGVQV